MSLELGRYAVHVLLSYGVTLLALGGLAWASWARWRRLRDALARQERRDG